MATLAEQAAAAARHFDGTVETEKAAVAAVTAGAAEITMLQRKRRTRRRAAGMTLPMTTKMLVAILLSLWLSLLVAVVDAEMMIFEIMRNPVGISDANGEWIELFNDSPRTIELRNWTLTSRGGGGLLRQQASSITINDALSVGPFGYVVLGANNAANSNGGVVVNYVYPARSLSLSRRDTLALFNPNTVQVDSVDWTSTSWLPNFLSFLSLLRPNRPTNVFPVRRGAALALKSPLLDNGLGTSWCLATKKYGSANNFGTPGAANDCTGPVVLPPTPPIAVLPTPPTPRAVAPVAPSIQPPSPVAAAAPTAAPIVPPTPIPPVAAIRIHAIQGNGSSIANTAFLDQMVNVTGICTSLLYTNDVVSSFFLQEEDVDIDNSTATSESILVVCAAASALNVSRCPIGITAGDQVQAVGRATEFAPSTSNTSAINVLNISTSSCTILSRNNALPAATNLTLGNVGGRGSTKVAASSLESLEGMVVRLTSPVLVTDFVDYARLGQLQVTQGIITNVGNVSSVSYNRPVHFTQTNRPNATEFAAYMAALNERTLILDDDTNDVNEALAAPNISSTLIDEPYFYPRPGLSITNRLRAGDVLIGLTGVLQFDVGGWRLRPIVQPSSLYNYTFVPVASLLINPTPTTNATNTTNITNPLPPPPPAQSFLQPASVGNNPRLKVAYMNLGNYFTTLDVGTSICGPNGGLECRGAHSAVELSRQRGKLVTTLLALNADIIGVAEVENSANDTALRSLVTALNAEATATSNYAFVATGPMGSEAIKVGLLYKNSTVAPLGAFRVLNRSVDPTFDDARNRPALIQTFVERNVGSGKLTLAISHFKSKGTSCASIGDPDLLDGQGNCPMTRRNASLALARFLATDPTNSSDADRLILGDLNAHAQEDAIRVLVNASYVDLIQKLVQPTSSAYTFLTDGQLSYVDYALASPSLEAQVTGLTVWHINADELSLFDYNDGILDRGELAFERKSANANFPLYAPDVRRSSDHDPILLGLNLTA